ncbi:4-hydroxybenzoate polyprenyltransferase [Candidatus Bathyarchaeota archaeon]|nr:4-hydroxybenzoate polyprenyltransferase [Candidatus Bathyarchaeota archaeon]
MVTSGSNKENKLHAYISNIRVFEWRAFFGMAVFGYLIGTKLALFFNEILIFTQFLITITFYLAFSFSINNCYDVEGDKLGEMISKNPIASGKLSRAEGLIQSYSIALSGVFLSFYWFGGLSALIYVFMTLLSWGYSAPPLRMKSTPFLDVLSHGLFFGSLLVMYGLSISGIVEVSGWVLIVSVYVFSLILQLRNHIEDAKEDSTAGVQTTVTKLGVDKSKQVLIFIYLVHVIFIASFLSFVNLLLVFVFFTVLLLSILFFRMRKSDFFIFLKVGDMFTSVAYIIFVVSILVG